ncbi:hypothetical protein OHB53_08095 [Streptomyces sp. NBC_00056]|uniref:hypothetical protein n=1 Tax=unclassified Streptomyces TaxID=2593676 RepID=UPI002E81C8F3|nr:hypothetical protein [Streptomyces sp. NBC_00569]WUB92286.1 hypothetical protein OHO83_08060 [Streptomyces sp. NBC_00569]
MYGLAATDNLLSAAGLDAGVTAPANHGLQIHKGSANSLDALRKEWIHAVDAEVTAIRDQFTLAIDVQPTEVTDQLTDHLAQDGEQLGESERSHPRAHRPTGEPDAPRDHRPA